MRAVIEHVRGQTVTCSLIGYHLAPIDIDRKKLSKALAEGSAIVYYDGKWFLNKKQQSEQTRLAKKLIADVFA